MFELFFLFSQVILKSGGGQSIGIDALGHSFWTKYLKFKIRLSFQRVIDSHMV